MIRYSPVTCFLIILALTGNPVGGAEDSDYEIIDIELLQEEDEETSAEEPDEKETPETTKPDENIGAVMESKLTGAAAETMNAAYTALKKPGVRYRPRPVLLPLPHRTLRLPSMNWAHCIIVAPALVRM